MASATNPNLALTYNRDRRSDPHPTDERWNTFDQGWLKAVNPNKADYGERAHRTLSWHNLGYRLGKLFGETDREMRKALYGWCVTQFRHSHTQQTFEDIPEMT